MSVLRMHLWKEWREHRAPLLGLLLVMPVVIAGLAWFAPADLRDVSWFRAIAVMLVVAAALLAVGGELLSAERKDGRLRWLERLPGGLAAAFRAKAVFFALTTLGATAYGLLVVRVVLGSTDDGSGGISPYDVLLVGSFGLLALWTLPASTWAPRGGLAVPLAALVSGVLVLPQAWLLADGNYEAPMWEIVTLVVMHLLAAPVASWLAFVHGARFGRSRLQAAGRALAVAALCLVPTWAWGSYRLYDRAQVYPGSPGFLLGPVFVTDDGATAFTSATQSSPVWNEARRFLLRIDLESAEWEVLAKDDADYQFDLEVSPRGHVLARNALLVLDGAGRLIGAHDQVDGRELAGESGDGLVEFHVRFRRNVQVLGTSDSEEGLWVYDPWYDQLFSLEELELNQWLVVVGRGRWIVESHEWNEFDYLDPRTGEREPTDWPGEVRPAGVLPDGRVLLNVFENRSESDECQYVFLCDPADGSLIRIESLDGMELVNTSRAMTVPFPREDVVLVKLAGGEHRELDPVSLTTRRIETGAFEWIPWNHAGRAIAAGAREIVKVDLGTGERVTLFPPTEL